MSDSESERPKDSGEPYRVPELTKMKKFTFWTEQSGVIVSPNSYELPNMPSPTENHKDPGIRHLVTNSTIYELFYPRLVVNRGPLFGRLDLSPSQIFNLVVELPQTFTGPTPLMGFSRQSQYSLPQELIDSWSRLENALINTASYLLRTHKHSSRFHPITYPKFPWQYGYRQHHATKADVVRCAIRSRDAFAMLSAVVTFVLSLWLTRAKASCFNRAFSQLSFGSGGPRTPFQWISHFEESYICNLSSGMRVGGFINPYECAWSHWIPHFVAAGVPLWFVWGHEFKNRHVRGVEIQHRLSPDEYEVEEAQLQSKFHPLSVAYSETPPLLYSQYKERNREEEGVQPIDYRSVLFRVERGSRQKPDEDWRDFLSRMQTERQDWIASESHGVRQIRQEREDRSSSGLWISTSAVFEWQHEGDFWRRVRVDRCDISLRWGNYTPNQRIYHGHINEWDLCPQISPTDSHQQYLDEQQFDTNDSDDHTIMNDTLYFPDDNVAHEGFHISIVNDLKATESIIRGTATNIGAPTISLPLSDPAEGINNSISSFDGNRFGHFTFLDYLKFRHGFTATADHRRNVSLHYYGTPSTSSPPEILKRLNYRADNTPSSVDNDNAILDFHNIIINPNIQLTHLLPSWDISPASPSILNLSRRGFELSVMTDAKGLTLYVIRSSETRIGEWVVATHNPTTILLAYRLQWHSLQKLVRLLLRWGVAFYMPRYIHAKDLGRPSGVTDDSHGLGWRSTHFNPTRADYSSYLIRRDDELRSGNGRSCRLVGGIVARLSCELVTEEDVLRGPTYCDVYLAEVGHGYILAEDETPGQVLDIVSGVYYTGLNSGIPNLRSWWPRDICWKTKSGFHIGEWSPDAEVWYQNRLRDIEEQPKLFSSTNWKETIRKYHSSNSFVIKASRRLSEDFIHAQSQKYRR